MFVRDPSTNPRTCRHTRRRCTQVQHLPTNFLFTKNFFVKLFRDHAINTTFGLIQLPVSPSPIFTNCTCFLTLRELFLLSLATAFISSHK